MDILTNENIIKLTHGAQAVTYEDIINTIEAVADNNGVDLLNCKQGQYKAVLREAQAVLFPKGSLKDASGKNNQYDTGILNQLAEVYIHISQKYNKYITPYAFGIFAGIPIDTILQWQCKDDLSRVEGSHIQKIISARNESITDGLFDSSNVTGKMMLANNVLGWNTSRSQTENTTKIERISTIESDFESLLNGSNYNYIAETSNNSAGGTE